MTGIRPLDYWRMGRARGWRYPIQYFVQSHLFDILRGTNTHFWLPPEEYDRVSPRSVDAVHYVACPTRSIEKALKAVSEHAGARFGEFQFVDLGCGKGKALLVYAEHTKSQQALPAVGIEITPLLARVAQNNVDILGLNARIRIAHDDARTWRAWCAEAPTILFLYNPFGKETLKSVVHAATDLDCYVAYVDPEHSAVLEDRGWSRIFRASGRYKNERIEVWHRHGRAPRTSSS